MLWSFIMFLCFNKNWRITCNNEIMIHEKSPESKTKGIKLESILYAKRKLILSRVCKHLLTSLVWSFFSKIDAFYKPESITGGTTWKLFLLKKDMKKWGDLSSFMFLSWWSLNYQKVLFSWYVLFPATNLSLFI